MFVLFFILLAQGRIFGMCQTKQEYLNSFVYYSFILIIILLSVSLYGKKMHYPLPWSTWEYYTAWEVKRENWKRKLDLIWGKLSIFLMLAYCYCVLQKCTFPESVGSWVWDLQQYVEWLKCIPVHTCIAHWIADLDIHSKINSFQYIPPAVLVLQN